MAHEIRVPRLDWSMEQGIFVGWRKQEGDTVRPGDVLFELESDKATQEIESLDAGVLRIPPDAPAAGATVAVGALLGVLIEAGEPAPWEVAGPAVVAQKQLAGIPLATAAPAAPRSAVAAPPRDAREQGRVRASPRARRVAAELGLDWTSINGTGRTGRVRERDVRAAGVPASAGPSSPSKAASSDHPVAGVSTIPLTRRRRTIAERMLASHQQTAPVTLTTRADATNLVGLRRQFQAVEGGAVPSYSDIVVKLAAAALARHPLLAARWEADGVALPDVSRLAIGLAVDTEQGLVAAVLRDVPRLSLSEVAQRAKELIERARGCQLTAADTQGGDFTITNLGAYGVDAFTPIINHPQAAILGLGAIRREPVVLDDGQIVPRDLITLSLTFDHRLLDGAPAARFLQDLSQAIENPSAWLLR